jgi:hypothetical protein
VKGYLLKVVWVDTETNTSKTSYFWAHNNRQLMIVVNKVKNNGTWWVNNGMKIGDGYGAKKCTMVSYMTEAVEL